MTDMKTKRKTWTHQVCEACYMAEYPGRIPYLFRESRDIEIHFCCRCAGPTVVGIYTRIDPETVSCNCGQEEE